MTQKYTFAKCYEKLSVFQTFKLDPEAEPRGIHRLKRYSLSLEDEIPMNFDINIKLEIIK